MSKKLTLFLQCSVLFIATFAVGRLIVDAHDTDTVKESSVLEQAVQESRVQGVIDSFTEEGQILEVRPAQGDPEPIEYNLQGSVSPDQQTREGLQQQGQQLLQPNAGINEIPELSQ